MRGTEYLIADIVFRWVGFRGCGGSGGDDAGELVAGYPREGRLVLVFAADLEEVEEVCAAGVHGDGVLLWTGLGGGDLGYLEV